jgi:hypothetical protein
MGTEAGLRFQPVVKVAPGLSSAQFVQVLGVGPDVILPEHRDMIRLQA